MPNLVGDAFYIGYTDILGEAWWSGDGFTEGEHFPRAVPMDKVTELVGFSPIWERIPYIMAGDEMGGVMAIHPTRKVSVLQGDKYVESPALLGIGGWQYPMSDYWERLIQGAAAITDQSEGELQIGSCGILGHGRKAFIQIALDEPMVHEGTGERYQPWLVAYSSLDGSFANTFSLCFIRIVCRNTFQLGRKQATAKYSYRNTKNGALNTIQARQVLDIFSVMGRDLWSEIDYYTGIEMKESQVQDVLEIIWPVKTEGLSKIHVTKNGNIRDDFMTMYANDPRVREFHGTAYGVLQTGNTLWQHGTELNPATIDKRQTKHGRTMTYLMQGKTAEKDDVTRDAIDKVIAMPAPRRSKKVPAGPIPAVV